MENVEIVIAVFFEQGDDVVAERMLERCEVLQGMLALKEIGVSNL